MINHQKKRQVQKRRDTQCNVIKFKTFGSTVNDTVDMAASNIDFRMEFKPLEPVALADTYWELLDGFKDLFSRRMGLITLRTLENHHGLSGGIDETRPILCAPLR